MTAFNHRFILDRVGYLFVRVVLLIIIRKYVINPTLNSQKQGENYQHESLMSYNTEARLLMPL